MKKKLPIMKIMKAPKSFITGKEKDKDKMVKQLHIVSKILEKESEISNLPILFFEPLKK